MSGIDDFYLPLQGKLAIVTGSSRGIGSGIAWELARRGADVCLTYTNEKSAARVEAFRARIAGLPHAPKSYTVRADLSTLDGPQDVLAQLAQQVQGELKVHILVNNAGFSLFKSIGSYTLQDYHAIYDLNLRGLIFLTQAVLPYLQAKGRIINIGSAGSRQGAAGLSIHAASKAAVDALTRGWAFELGANGTTVNCVAPGPVPSDLLDQVVDADMERDYKARTPLEHRFGTVQEIGAVVAWLASDDASWITGQNISASGGLTML